MDGLSFLGPLEGGGISAEDSTLVDLALTALRRDGGEEWDVQVEGMWCAARPPAHRMRDQGWKLHVSATRFSAAEVLGRSLDVLVRHRCAFKVANSLRYAALLCSTRYPRGSAGKFLTAYPDDDEHFRLLACELDRSTAGLAGPAILSDRPYRAGSLVHYRYGAFADRRILTNDGVYKQVLRTPDGMLVEDVRDAWFTPPAGISLPFGEDPPPAGPAANEKAAPRPVLLADRFVVREAIRHANRGGVFRAVDLRTDTDVVVKQARPHIAAGRSGADIRDVLRHEAAMLDVLAPTGIVPRNIALFEQGGHLFLAEELILGVPLRRWVAEQAGGGPGLAWPLAAATIRRLARLLAAAHGAGLAVRDFTPLNVLVVPGGDLRLVDLELAAPLGSEAVPAGNPGYAAHEQLAGAPPSVDADLYSLGAISFLLATANDPRFCEDDPALRPTRARLEHWLTVTAGHSEAARRLAPMILGLMDEMPERRWNLERVEAFLDAAGQPTMATSPREPDGPRLRASEQERLIEDGWGQLLAWMAPEKDRLWPTTCIGAETDPCNVAHGAAGVVGVLARLAQTRDDRRVHEALGIACSWVERRMAAEPRVLPGLYFGRSGTAWALYDAARVLGDGELAERAITLAKRVPVVWPNPDVAHGTAGCGLTQLYFWQATNDPEFAQRLQQCADGLVAAAERGSHQAVWPIPTSFGSRLAGGAHYGFAHGIAGVGWFLLAAGQAADRDDWVALACQAGEVLCAAAERHGDRATWSEGMTHWSHSFSGVGSFLVRLWQASGEERHRELAELAAVAVRRTRWQAARAVWHGLAGNGEFLLDLAGKLNQPRYQDWAEELAAVIAARAAHRQGRVIPPDDSGINLSADYAAGLAGVVAFLLRLRDGGPRLWMAEPAAVPATR
ncbi:MAG: class IV lanthionine synthetase LanL [Egibacteraceae bacterium]